MNPNHAEIREILLANGAEIMSIHAAVKLVDIEKVKDFLERGVDINSKDDNADTPLFIAISNNYNDIAEFLIDQGADVNDQNWMGQTPLHLACLSSENELVELLINSGADINASNLMDRTPLDLAQQAGNEEIIELLNEYGAEPGTGAGSRGSMRSLVPLGGQRQGRTGATNN